MVTEADWVFIPEWPPDVNWPEKLCNKLRDGRETAGQRLNIIIVAEGALDREGNAITCEQIKKVVVDNLQQDTRITVLGHVQRGGAPSAFDRVLGCRLGAEAVLALMDASSDSEPVVVSLAGNTPVRLPLMKCVTATQAVTKAMKERQWLEAVQLRGRSFQRNLETYKMLTKNKPKAPPSGKGTGYNLAFMHIGAPCGGMNAAVRSFVRNCIAGGNRPFAVHNGIEGLMSGDVEEMKWSDVNGWIVLGGALLGTKRTLPKGNFDKVWTDFFGQRINN